MNNNFLNKNRAFKTILPYVTIPALLVGVYTMIHFKVPIKIWCINLSVGFLFMIVAFLFNNKVFQLKRINPYLIIFISATLIMLTFLSNEMMSVHRWINFGSLQLNIGMLVSPLILIQISKLKNQLLSYLLFIFITILFILQPDASIATAFSISSMIIFYKNSKNKTIIIGLLIFTVFAITYSWLHLDKLPAVSYVENIINLTWQISPYLTILSIASLLLLVYPFLVNGYKTIPLGVYFSLLIISSFIGNFPVIIIGYGIAPFIGYFIAQIWLIEVNKKDSM